MAEQQERAAAQRDAFTMGVAFVFICMVALLADGFYEFGSQRAGARGAIAWSMRLQGFFVVYVLPGLLCGVTWRKWGFLLGAGAVMLIWLASLINHVMVASNFEKTEVVPNLMLSLALAGGVGAASGLLGQVLSKARLCAGKPLRLLNDLSLLLAGLTTIVAGGLWLWAFMPFGEGRAAKTLGAKLRRFGKFSAPWERPLVIVMWVSILLVVISVLFGLRCLLRHRGARETEASEPSPDA
jgi:hypothetical protein